MALEADRRCSGAVGSLKLTPTLPALSVIALTQERLYFVRAIPCSMAYTANLRAYVAGGVLENHIADPQPEQGNPSTSRKEG